MAKVAVLKDADEVVSSLTGFRRQILHALDAPDSATGLADKLDTTRQRINYHLRALETAGLVELEEVRQRRGLQERVMRRVSDVVLVDPTAFSGVSLSAADTAGVTGVIVTATDLIRQAAEVSNGASESGGRVATATLDTEVTLQSPADLRRLINELGEVIARYNSAQGLTMRIATIVLPKVEARDG